jgi:hypothetical protein
MKKAFLTMMAVLLAFGMMVIGCEQGTGGGGGGTRFPPDGDANAFTSLAEALAYLSSHSDGSSADNPVPLKLNINLSSATDGWGALVVALESRKKYVALDLSACSMSGTEFDLYAGAIAGKNYIVSLILPDNATSITSSSSTNSTYTSGSGYCNNSYSKLRAVSGANVINIGDYAFFACTALTTVSFPEVTSIIGGELSFGGAFSGCTSLTSASFPKATSIGNGAFSGCTSLITVDFPKANTITSGSIQHYDGAFSGCTALTSVSFPEATSIGNSAFSGCTSLTTVDFPKATSIGGGAFYGCIALTTVSVPETTSIGYWAFRDCTSLTTVSIPKVTSIGYEAFANTGTTPLTITMGAGAPTVGYRMFYGINDSRNVTVRVPNGAIGYDEEWQEAFKGLGNDDINYGVTPTVNEYINLVVEYYY